MIGRAASTIALRVIAFAPCGLRRCTVKNAIAEQFIANPSKNDRVYSSNAGTGKGTGLPCDEQVNGNSVAFVDGSLENQTSQKVTYRTVKHAHLVSTWVVRTILFPTSCWLALSCLSSKFPRPSDMWDKNHDNQHTILSRLTATADR